MRREEKQVRHPVDRCRGRGRRRCRRRCRGRCRRRGRRRCLLLTPCPQEAAASLLADQLDAGLAVESLEDVLEVEAVPEGVELDVVEGAEDLVAEEGLELPVKGGGHGGPPDPRDEGGQGLGQPSLRPTSLTGGPSSQALLLQVADEGREGEGEAGGQ